VGEQAFDLHEPVNNIINIFQIRNPFFSHIIRITAWGGNWCVLRHLWIILFVVFIEIEKILSGKVLGGEGGAGGGFEEAAIGDGEDP
jgi:hypothetical protein